jgi:hypothetical protein
MSPLENNSKNCTKYWCFHHQAKVVMYTNNYINRASNPSKIFAPNSKELDEKHSTEIPRSLNKRVNSYAKILDDYMRI